MNSKDFKKIILDKLNNALKQKNFAKTGNSFISSNNELNYIINVQSSQSSNINTLKITVNIDIASTILSKLEDTPLPEKHRRHFSERIGSYLNQPQDKWWIIENTNMANAVAIEIIELINNKIIPELDKLQTTHDLANLWRQGNSPGLTNFQRNKYLSLLKSSEIS